MADAWAGCEVGAAEAERARKVRRMKDEVRNDVFIRSKCRQTVDGMRIKRRRTLVCGC